MNILIVANIILRIKSRTYGDFEFLIDTDDVERCKAFSWCVLLAGRKQHRKYFYASTQTKEIRIMLHRYITNCPKDMIVDHINGNILDTRKNNLRITTKQINCINRKLSFNNTSGVNGVTWDKASNKWMAYIHVHDRFKNLGYFDNLELAKQARLSAEEVRGRRKYKSVN